MLLLLAGVERNPGPSHNECRSKVCAVCYLKSDKDLEAYQGKLIKNHIDQRFDINILGLPSGLCIYCHLRLLKKKISFTRSPVQSEFADASFNYGTSHESKVSCSCKVCEVANSSGLAYIALKKKIVAKGEVKKKMNNACSKCFTILYRGCSRICNQSSKKKNIKAAANEVIMEEIANDVIKRKVNENKDEDGQSMVKLRSGGRPSLFTVKRGRVAKKTVIRKDTILQAKVAAGLSNRQTNTVMQILRTDIGKVGIEAGLQQHLVDQNKKFTPYFTTERVLMKVTRKNLIKERGENTGEKIRTKGRGTEYIDSPVTMAYCNDVNAFYAAMLKERGIENSRSIICKVGLDDGRGKMKVNLSALPKYENPNNDEKKFLEKFKVIFF